MKIAQLKQKQKSKLSIQISKTEKRNQEPKQKKQSERERNDEATCFRKASHEEVVVTSIADLSQNSFQFPSLLFNDDRK